MPAGTSIGDLTYLLDGFGKNLDLPAGSATAWISPNLDAIMEAYGAGCLCNTGVAGGDFRLLGLENGSTALGHWRDVTEKNTGLWAQLDWDTEWGGMPVRGNFGGRWVNTEIEAAGYSALSGVTTRVTGVNNYDDILPSLNLSIEPIEDVMVRFGAARVMARPPVTSLVPVFPLSAPNAANRPGSAGNVDPDP